MLCSQWFASSLVAHGQGSPEISRADQGNAIPAIGELGPEEWYRWKAGFKHPRPGANLKSQPAVSGQKRHNMVQDSRRAFHPVDAGNQGETGFVAILRRKRGQIALRHIGRIAHDEVEGAFNPGKEIGAQQLHPVFEAVARHVSGSHRQRIGGDITGHNPGFGKGQRQGHSNAAAARPDLQDALDLPRVEPGLETALDQLRKGRTGNQDTLIHAERQSGKPGFAREVGQGPATGNAQREQRLDPRQSRRGDRQTIGLLCIAMVKTQLMKDQGGGFVPGVPRTVTKKDAGLIKARGARGDQPAHRVRGVLAARRPP